MNIPVTPYFFNKLAIYERIKKGDRLTSKRLTWFGEEALLMWSVQQHEHLYSTLRVDRARDIVRKRIPEEDLLLKEVKPGDKIKYENPEITVREFYSLIHIRKVLGNLHQRGLAKIIDLNNSKEPETIRFTEEGRIWGDVLSDIDEGKVWKYEIPLQTIRLAAILFLGKVIVDSVQTLIAAFFPAILSVTKIKCFL